MASVATDFLIGRIGTILENEASSIVGIRDQVDEIKLELVSMKSFLQDAEGNKACTKGEETWIASVRDHVYDVEDIIDEFMYHVSEQLNGDHFARWLRKTISIPDNWYKGRFARWLRQTTRIPRKWCRGCFARRHRKTSNRLPKGLRYMGRFARWLNKTIHLPAYLYYRRQIAQKLHKITKAIKNIPERSQRYGNIGRLEGRSTSHDIHKRVQNQAESSLFVKEDELVGIEGKKQILTGWLMTGAKHQVVISVFGMGGSGKTTLVAKTFTDETVKRHFDCCAWITVSQNYLIEDLFKNLIKELHQARKEAVPIDINSMSYRELLHILVNYLDSKRYLVVLDDVWNIDLWREIRISLPDRQLGSRVMLTTRKEDIAFYSFGLENHVYQIQPLSETDAWELFGKNAFSTYHNKSCPPELQILARDFLEKCKGLPLAIVTLGGLMSTKKSTTEWSKVYNNLNWHLMNNQWLEPIKPILVLSFDDLPCQLKHCFLYCSLFPEDYSIQRKRLIRLWIAEGFVEHVKGVTPEDVADSYLSELCFRSMLQVVKRNETGRPKQCKMHDLMRELALSTSEKEKFCTVSHGGQVREEIGTRRLSIQTTGDEIKSYTGMPQLRSFLVFVTDISSFSFSNSLIAGLKLLRTLDLEAVPIDKLPDGLMNLYNLRYLNLKGTLIKELPESIGQLQNLQTLNVVHTKIKKLPEAIAKLLNLCYMHHHLWVYEGLRYASFRHATGVKVPSDICKLKKLQVLANVQSEGNFIRLVGNMTQLKRIGITNVKQRDEKDLCFSLKHLKLLRSLFLMASDEDEVLRISALSLPHLLEKLFLAGKLEVVPSSFCSLQSLTYLYLRWSRLEQDLLPHIQALPNLRELALNNAYVGKAMCFSKGFVKLTRLVLRNFPFLNTITIEKGVMPNLQFLWLDSCMELKTVPLGIEYLSNLEKLDLSSVPMEVIKSITKGGINRPVVEHIPEIRMIYEKLSLQYGRLSECSFPRRF